MEIDRFEFFPDGDTAQPPVTLGLNIKRKYGLTWVNLFALDENKGPPVSRNLWQAARQIADQVLGGEDIGNINWTLTAGYATSDIKFTTAGGKPAKIDISNHRTLQTEQLAQRSSWPEAVWSLSRYADEYEGAPPAHVKNGRVRVRTPEPEPKSAFAIPCAHPAAKDGVFYCQPSFYDSDHIRDKYEYLMVDTRKLLAKIGRDDPHMIQHADYKFRGETAEQWLEANSIEYPADMGFYTYGEDTGLTMCSGNAGMLKLAQEMDIPCFPIALEKGMGQERLRQLASEIGYSGGGGGGGPSMKPTFS